MASKTVTIEPVQAIVAGCRATCASYYDGTKEGGPSYDGINYTNYQCAATVATGWRFLRFEYTIKGTTNHPNGHTYTETITLNTNPAPVQQITNNWANPFEYEVIGDDGSVYMTIKEEIISVVAYFEEIPVHVPTHLLVNSFSKSTPVQLVYDPTTNLLVADF